MARIVIPDLPHHVTQRGNRGARVFLRKADYRRYLTLLTKYCELHALKLAAYCLMPNHVHLIVIPSTASALALALKPIHLRYAQELNRRLEEHGALWQPRFFSCPMDDDHFRAAVRYVERNPVRAKMVERAEDYPWSSAAGHCGLRADDLLVDVSDRIVLGSDWSTWLTEEDDEDSLDRLRKSTRTGRPAGSASFIESLETIVGRSLRPGKAGRPRKQNK
jgi:REP-associated tyrosine transposase